jgi:serine/threonine protein kinase
MPQRWHWAVQVTETIARCHDRGILIFDISRRNVLLKDDLDLRTFDFANSSLIPQSEDIAQANIDRCTAALDLFHLANVIYSIIIWQPFSVDCAMDSE